MYMLMSFLLAINLFAFSYAAGESNEDNDKNACTVYFTALDDEIVKMIKAEEMPSCWDPRWDNMNKDVEDMTEEDGKNIMVCLIDVMKVMKNKPEPGEECVESMKEEVSSDNTSEERKRFVQFLLEEQ